MEEPQQTSGIVPEGVSPEEAFAEFMRIGDRYGFEADLESIPRLCEEYGLRM